MRELCLKLDEKEIERILVTIDVFLKKQHVRVKELFDANDKFDIHSALKTNDDYSRYDADELDFYFHDYSYNEFMTWVAENMEIYKKYAAQQQSISNTQSKTPIKTASPKKGSPKNKTPTPATTVYKHRTPTPKGNSSETNKLYDALMDYTDKLTEITMTNIKKDIKRREEGIEYIFHFSKTSIISDDPLIDDYFIEWAPKDFTMTIYINDEIWIDTDIDLDLYEVAASDLSYEYFPDDNDYHMKVRKYHDEGHIRLVTSYFMKDVDLLESIIDTILGLCVTPSYTKKGYPVYKLSYVESNASLFNIPEFQKITSTPKAKTPSPQKTTQNPILPQTVTPSSTPIIYKQGLVNFKLNGKRLKLNDLPAKSNYEYKDTGLTVEKIRTMGKAGAFKKLGVLQVYDYLFYTAKTDTFIMIAIKRDGNLYNYEFKFDGSVINYGDIKVLVQNVGEVTPDVFMEKLYDQYNDVILIYEKK